MREQLRRLPYTLILLLGISIVATTVVDARAQVAPPTMTGEEFVGTITLVERTCTTAGTSTIRYTSTGVAAGPYPGFFTETGTVTIGPQTNFDPEAGTFGTITGWEASFEILSGVIQVTGTKRLGRVRRLDPLFNTGNCVDAPTPIFPDATSGTLLLASSGYLAYTATIQTPLGQFTDRGEPARGGGNDNPVESCISRREGAGCSFAGIAHFDLTCDLPTCPTDRVFVAIHTEEFYSSLTTTVPVPVLGAKPGKGCGDKNHDHERNPDCKK